MKALILYDHIREEHFKVTDDNKTRLNIFNTQNGKTLKMLLERCSGLVRDNSRRDYDIDFVYKAIPTPITNNYGKIVKYQDIKQSEVKPYYSELTNRIIDNDYDIIIPLGKLGIKFLLNVTKLGSVRGVPHKVTLSNEQTSKDVWVLSTYSIEYTNVNKNAERHVVTDLNLLGKFVNNGEEAFKPKEVSYELVTSIERVREIFTKEVKKDNNDGIDITAWDTETNSLKPDRTGSKVLVVSLSWKNGQGVTIPVYKSDFKWKNGQKDIDEILGYLREWLADKEDIKVAHNGQYDIKYLMSTENFQNFENMRDTKVGWYLAVTQEQAESLRLSDLSYEVTDMGGYDKPLEDFKKWFKQKLLKLFTEKMANIIKDNKSIAKKEHNIKATEYKDWLSENISVDKEVELDKYEQKTEMNSIDKQYIQLGLHPERLTKTMLINDSDFEEVIKISDEYMALSDEGKEYTLKVALELINKFKKHTDVYNEVDGSSFNYDWIPLELMHPYASGDVDVCRRIYKSVVEKLEEQKRPKAFELLNVSYPRLTRTLARIESNGFYTDKDFMLENDKYYRDEMQKTHDKMREHWAVKEFEENKYNLYEIGLEEFSKPKSERDLELESYRTKYKDDKWKFSPSSGANKGEVLYDILGIKLPYDKNYIKDKPFDSNTPEEDLTWEDYKTDKATMNYALNDETVTEETKELLKLMIYYASMQTKRNSFTKKLPLIRNNEKGTIHGSFNSTGTETGRLSSSNPNMQNLPSHTSDVNQFDYHHPVKRSFVSRYKDGVLIQLDYSALEMRIIGLYTKDPDMLSSFLNGDDVHKATASIVYGKPTDEITQEERQQTKKVNFGLAYGESPFSFAGKNNMTVEEAEDIFEKYFNTKPNVKKSIDDVHEFAKQYGYVDTMQGHRRFIHNAMSKDTTKRNEALRQSFNTIIQGTGGFLTNMSLTYIDDFIQQRNMKSKIVATVHDSIVIDCPPEEVKLIGKVSKHIMENLPYDFLSIEIDGEMKPYPIEADYEIGLSYNDMVDYDEELIKDFNSYKGYIKYKMALQTIEDYFESGKITEEEKESKENYIKENKEAFTKI